MAKNTNGNTNRVASVIACVAALGLVTATWAQTDDEDEKAHWQLDVKEPVTYAQEIFGGDATAADNLDLTLNGDVPYDATD